MPRKIETLEDVAGRGFLIGEGLSMPAGDLAHAAHIDLVGGLVNGLMGPIFASSLSEQKPGHTNLLATPVNLLTPPYAVIIPKVTMTTSKQILQMFCDAQIVVAQAFARAVKNGVIPKKLAPFLCFNVGVFIDKGATDSKLIREHNAAAMDLAIAVAMNPATEEDMDKLVDACLTAEHPLTELTAEAGRKAAAAAKQAA